MSIDAGNFLQLPTYTTIASLPTLGSEDNGVSAFCSEVGRPIYSSSGEWFRYDGTAVANNALGLIAAPDTTTINGNTFIPIFSSAYTGPLTATPVWLKLSIGFQAFVYNGNNRRLIFRITIGGVIRLINVSNLDTSTSPATYMGTVDVNIKLYENTASQNVCEMDALAFSSDAELVSTTNETLTSRDANHPHFNTMFNTLVTNNPVDITVDCRFNVSNANVNAVVSPKLARLA